MRKTDDKTWLLQENSDDIIRSMSDPNKYEQPAYVWDRYYVPEANEATENNDEGGVHTNSSLLNLIAWRLNESGMDPTDQLYYWQNIAMTVNPGRYLLQIAFIDKETGETYYIVRTKDDWEISECLFLFRSYKLYLIIRLSQVLSEKALAL